MGGAHAHDRVHARHRGDCAAFHACIGAAGFACRASPRLDGTCAVDPGANSGAAMLQDVLERQGVRRQLHFQGQELPERAGMRVRRMTSRFSLIAITMAGVVTGSDAAIARERCIPRDNSARVLSSPTPNDVHPDWSGDTYLGTSWSFDPHGSASDHTGQYLRGNLFSPRGGLVSPDVYNFGEGMEVSVAIRTSSAPQICRNVPRGRRKCVLE